MGENFNRKRFSWERVLMRENFNEKRFSQEKILTKGRDVI